MITYKLHFIRHGLTEYNTQGRYLGLTDAPVSAEGVAELERLRREYRYPDIERVYSSPLLRCIQTAHLLYPGERILTVDKLREYDFGAFEGRTIEELAPSAEYRDWLESAMRTAPPDGESGEAFAERLTEALEYIFDDMMTFEVQNAAVITHAGVILTLLSMLGLPRPQEGNAWYSNNGMGYTIQMTPQMWMRDRLFEIRAIVPALPEGDAL